MQRKLGIVAAALLLWAFAPAAPRAAAQGGSALTGIVKDTDGKPLANATVELKSTENAAVLSAKSDATGHYKLENIRPGTYDLALKDPQGETQVQSKIEVRAGGTNTLDLNLKELISPEVLAARKKQEEAAKTFQSMKAAFDAGRALMVQADQVKAGLVKASAEERGPMQQKLNGIYGEALGDFQQSQTAAGEKDPNLHVIVFNIGEADEGLGKNDEAVAAYQKAIELAQTGTGKSAVAKSQIAGYYSNLGNLLGKMGKVDEANKAYEQGAAADPANAATVWLNSGITLYKANRLTEAIVPLKKATELNPNNADAWYLLGASLLANIETKQEGDKLTYIIPPGTVEAYQKYLKLAPSGPHAADAQAALDNLQAIGAGVETKVKVKKGKS